MAPAEPTRASSTGFPPPISGGASAGDARNPAPVQGTIPDQGREKTREEAVAKIDAAIESFQAGVDREQSFQLLFNAYHRPLLRFFARKGCPTEDSHDLTQETLLGIYRGLDGFRHESRVETWVYRIATTAFLKRLRAKHTAMRAGEEISTDDDIPEQILQKPAEQLRSMLVGERSEQLTAAIDELPEQMRRALVLRIHRQHSYKEIAIVMRVSIDTVKAHLFQARKKLKDKLGESAVGSLEKERE